MKVILNEDEWQQYLRLKRRHADMVNQKLEDAKKVVNTFQHQKITGNRVIALRTVKAILEGIDELRIVNDE